MSRWIRPAKRLAIYLRDGLSCVYCGASVEDADGATKILTLDHVMPRKLGGSNEARNLVTACLSCNLAKGDKRLSEWLDRRDHRRAAVYRHTRRKIGKYVSQANTIVAERAMTCDPRRCA